MTPHTLVLATTAALAPLSSAAPASQASTPPHTATADCTHAGCSGCAAMQQPSKPAAPIPAELRAYHILLAAANLELLSRTAAEGKLGDSSNLILQSITAQLLIPGDKLPSPCQEYLKLIQELHGETLPKLKEAQDEQTTSSILEEWDRKKRLINLQHTEAARLMDPSTASRYILPDLKIDERIQTRMIEKTRAAGAEADPNKIISETFAEMVAELLEVK